MDIDTMDKKSALSELEKIKTIKYNLESFDKIKELFQYFFRSNNPKHLATLLFYLIYYNKYDWFLTPPPDVQGLPHVVQVEPASVAGAHLEHNPVLLHPDEGA